MSELLSQVSALRKQHVQANPLHSGRASLFLSPQEAATVDVSVVYNAAVTGLNTLIQYDQRFSVYFDGLLSPNSVTTQRELLTPAENKKLDVEISSLLSHLSLFAHEKCTHLVLEFLIRRFVVHEMNVDVLLRSMIVAHDTKVFSRLVQLSTIEGTAWEFLAGIKKSGGVLPRSIIVQKANKDEVLLGVLCHMAKAVLDLATSSPSLDIKSAVASGLDRVMSFFTAVVVEMAEDKAFNADKMGNLVLLLLNGLKSNHEDKDEIVFETNYAYQLWRRMSCMIIVQICRKTSFAKPLMKALSNALAIAFAQVSSDSAAYSVKVASEVVITMSILAHHQKINISYTVLSTLFAGTGKTVRGETFLKVLKSLSLNSDVNALSLAVSTALLTEVLYKNKAGEHDNADTLSLSTSSVVTILCNMMTQDLIHAKTLRSFLSKVLVLSVDAKSSIYTNKETTSAAHRLIRHLYLVCTEDFDEIVKETLSVFNEETEVSVATASTLLNDFLHSAFSEQQFKLTQGAGVNLLLSLCSPIQTIRTQALKNLSTCIELDCESTADVVGICEAAARNLLDANEEVALIAWSEEVLVRVAQHTAAAEFLTTFQCAYERWANIHSKDATRGKQVLTAIVAGLKHKDVQTLLFKSDSSAATSWLFGIVLEGALSESDAAAVKTAYEVAASASNVPLFTGLKKFTASLNVFDALVVSVSTHVTDATLYVLTDLVVAKLRKSKTAGSIVNSLSAVKFLIAVAGRLKDNKKSAPLSHVLLEALCPLILLSIDLLTRSALTASVTEQLVDHLKSFIALSSEGAAHKTASSSKLVNNIQNRVLVKLLDEPSLVQLLGQCLATYHSANSSDFLLQVVLLSEEAAEGAFVVSNKTRASALLALSSYVSTIQAKSGAFSAHDSSLLLSLVPVVISACASSKDFLRAAGLSVARRIASLDTKHTLTFETGLKGKVSKNPPSVADLVAITSEIVKRESIIALDAQAVFITQNAKLLIKITHAFTALHGWSVPQVTASLVRVLSASSLEDSWDVLHTLLDSAVEDSSKASEQLASALVQSLERFPTASDKSQLHIVEWFAGFMKDRAGLNRLNVLIGQNLIELFASGVAAESDKNVKSVVYSALIQEQLTHPGRTLVLTAIGALKIDIHANIVLFTQEVAFFKVAYHQFVHPEGKNDTVEEGDEDDTRYLTSMSTPLARLSSFLEAVLFSLKEATVANSNELGVIAGMLMDVLPLVNHAHFKLITVTEECKIAIVDIVHLCVSVGGTALVGTVSSKHNLRAGYTISRIGGDIHLLLSCLSGAKSVSLQSSALALLQLLAKLSPSDAVPAVGVLGQLLSNSSVEAGALALGSDGLVFSILRTFIAVLPNSYHDVIESLCEHFFAMSNFRRSSLVKMALKLINNQPSVNAAVTVLLTHAFAAGEFVEDRSAPKTNLGERNGHVMVLLSRQRGTKGLAVNVKDEFSALAVDVLVTRPPAVVVSVIVSLVHTTMQLFESGLNYTDSKERSSELTVDISRLQDYSARLLTLAGQGKKSPHNANNQMLCLAILHLEYLTDVLENKQFHVLLAQDNGETTQDSFLELVDVILQLQFFATSASELFSEDTKTQNVFKNYINSWCVDALKTIQRLVDEPTFVTIMQELINHDQVEVRQKVLLMLTERLEVMTSAKKSHKSELNLYLDLSTKLRQIVVDFIAFVSSTQFTTEEAFVDFHQRVGLTQSAIMCTDILSRFLGQQLETQLDLSQILAELVALTSVVSAVPELTQFSEEQNTSTEFYSESLKVLGSAFLCCGSICGVLGVKSLSVLSTLTTNIFSNITLHGAAVFDDETDSDTLRSRVLFVRVLISSLTILASSLPLFFHPYIKKTLLSILKFRGISALTEVEESVDQCLSAIATKIPLRNALPALLDSAATVLASGHIVSCRFAELMGEIWANLDRSTITSNLSSLFNFSTLMLDYRRVFGDQSSDGDDVDIAVSEAVVELCLKLTENELKQFLNYCIEWRDAEVTIKSEADNWRVYSRRVSFYALIEALTDKLKSLFETSLDLFWTHASEQIEEFQEVVASIASEQKALASSHKKKRNHDEYTEDPASSGEVSKVTVELTLLVRRIMTFVTTSCTHSTQQFMNEARYQSMMAPIVSLLPLRAAFSCDTDYLAFIHESVNPTLSGLATAIANDILWKPLNHKVLLAMRDKKKVVRMAAISTLHGLFSEVGEEYLLLLPECLPFLSELMEDDSREVTTLTKDTLRFLEELSGEKLESYLQ